MLMLDCSGRDNKDLFNVSGSRKRMRDLQAEFERPPRYGKGLDWTGYTIHDAASLLLRYLNQLPESLIPASFYGRALRVEVKSSAVEADKGIDIEAAEVALNSIIQEIPFWHRWLLVSIIDLVVVLLSAQEINETSSVAAASIFKSCILANPAIEDTDPVGYAKARDVVIFMIEHPELFFTTKLTRG